MVEYINFLVCNFIFSLSAIGLQKKIFSLETKNIYLIFLQIFSLSAGLIYLFCGISFFVFLLLEILALFIMILLTTNEYSFYNITIQFFVLCVLFFAMIGFYEFLYLFYSEVIEQLANKKIAKYYKFVIILAIFLQYYVINAIIDYFKESRLNKKLLKNVSFLLFGQHIEITGLIDSGNSVTTKTNIPVIIISKKILQKYLSQNNYENITKAISDCEVVNCKTVSKEMFKMPVIRGNFLEIKIDEKKCCCALGVVENSFYDEDKFECLIHRDFL